MRILLNLATLLLVSITACRSSETPTRKASVDDPLTVTSNKTSNYNRTNEAIPYSSPSSPQSNSPAAEIDDQMNVAELREKLDEVKDIELKSRRMVALRQNWMEGAAECNRIMQELKPRARAIAGEYKRMLSPAGIEIASAASSLTICINCLENDDDTDCRLAREWIKQAEKELKKEIRQK